MKKTSSASLFYLYIFLWIVYLLNGVVFEPSGIVIRLSLLFIMLISLYNVYTAHIGRKQPKYVMGVDILVFVFTIYGVWFIFDPVVLVNESGEKMIHYVYLKQVYMSLLPFYSFYTFSLCGSLNYKNILYLLPLFIILALIKYFDRQHLIQVDVYQDNFTNNVGYQFAAFLPYVFLLEKKKNIQYLLLLFLITMCFLSAKRGSIIVSLVFLGWFIYSRMRYSKRNKGKLLLGTILVIVAVYYIFNYFVLNNAYFASRLDTTVGGDREEVRSLIYADLFDWFLHDNTTYGFLLGNGPYTSVKIIGMLAHNDWLEIALAIGCVGLVSYLFYWICLIQTAKVFKRGKKNLAYYILISFFLIYFMKSMFSMSYDTIPVAASMILALAIANPSIDTD